MAMTPNTWLAGTWQGLYQSDNGTHWTRVADYDYRITGIARRAPDLFVSTGGGLWQIPPDNGLWIQRHDETLTEVLDLALIPGDPGLVAASAYGVATAAPSMRWAWHSDRLPINARYTNTLIAQTATRWVIGTEAGLLVTQNAGANWTYSSLTGNPVRALIFHNNRWWAGADDLGIWTSTDALTWVRAGTGCEHTTVFALAPTDNGLIAGTDNGILVGTGNGPWHPAGLQGQMVNAVAATPYSPNRWLAGCCPGGLWTTHNAGTTWQQVPSVPDVETLLPPEAIP